MKRDMESELIKWKDQEGRSPLIVRGPRQVGKSYIIESFGKNNFQNCITANFEFQPQLKECFNSFDPVEIVNSIQLLLGTKIEAGKTLLFLDEIQECPRAIMALRYFKEKMPRLHVIGAGSLLEFALKDPALKMPVGRIHFLYLDPLSFLEFIDASGNEQLRKYLLEIDTKKPIENIFHDKLMELIRVYLIVGGMPAVVKSYIISKDMVGCQSVQNDLIQTYQNDFTKYAKSSQFQHLRLVFDAAPRLVGQRIKYVNIDSESKSREIKTALNLLSLAGIIDPVYATAASGLPLGAQININKFKLNFLDVGLMQNMLGLQGQLIIEKDFMQINAGSVVEQFVGQELKACSDKNLPRKLFFWTRDRKNSSAEVDYLINIGAEIVPLEVKAGKTGSLKSLRLFLKEKKSHLGVRVSQEKLSFHNQLLSVPLYMVEQIPRLIRQIGS